MTAVMKACLCGVMGRHTTILFITTGILVNLMTALGRTVLSCLADVGMMTAVRRSIATSVKDRKVGLQ